MTRKRRARAAPDLEDDDDVVGQGDDVEASEADLELEQLLESLGGDGLKVRVYRVETNGELAFLRTYAAQLYIAQGPELLRADFEGGKFEAHVIDGKNRIRKRRTITVARLARPESAPPPAAAAAGGDRVRELEVQLAAERERSAQRQHEMMLALIGRPAPPAPAINPLEMQQQLLSGLTQMREFIGGKGEGGGLRELLGLLDKFEDLREKFGGGGTGRARLEDVMVEGVKALPKIADALKGGGSDSQAEPTGDTSRSRNVTREGSATTSSQQDRIVAMVLKHAQAGTAPAVVAPLLYAQLEKLDDDVFEAACALLMEPAAAKLLMTLEPRLAPASTWIESVLGQLRPLISANTDAAPLTPEEVSPDAAGDT